MRVSYTQLDLYRLCPRKYRFYKDKAPQDPKRTAHLRFGQAVHKALEFAYSRRYKAPSPEQVIAYFHRLSEEETDPEVQKMFAKGAPAIREYLSKNNPRDLHILEVERKFLMALDENHEVVGVIDRLDMLPDGSFEVIDYKSGVIANAEKLKDNWQLAIYQFAKQRQLQTKRIVTSLVFVLHGGHKLSQRFSEGELSRIRKEILALIAQIEKDTVFQTRTGSWCETCPYQPICPAWIHKFSYTDVLTGKEKSKEVVDMQAKIDRLLSLTAQIKRLRDETEQLKTIIADYAKHQNLTRLYSDLGTLSIAFHKRRTYDVAMLTKDLREDLLRKIVKTIDAKKLERALPYLGDEEREAIEHAAKEEETVSVTARPSLDEEAADLLTP